MSKSLLFHHSLLREHVYHARRPPPPPLAASSSVSARARRSSPYSSEQQQRIHPAVEPGACSREERTQREREIEKEREREREIRQKMDVAGSFGAGRSGSTIDPYTFAKQPQTILRVLSWVSARSFFFSLRRARVCMVCVCVCGGGGGLCVVVAARDPWRVLTANPEPQR